MTDGQSEACAANGPWASRASVHLQPHVYPVTNANGVFVYVLRRINNRGFHEFWCQQWGSNSTTFATATEAEAKLTEILAAERHVKTSYDAQLVYSIALRHAIEWHCRGELVPENIAKECPQYADMLNRDLRVSGCSLTQSQRGRIAKLLTERDYHKKAYHNIVFTDSLGVWMRDVETLLREIAG